MYINTLLKCCKEGNIVLHYYITNTKEGILKYDTNTKKWFVDDGISTFFFTVDMIKTYWYMNETLYIDLTI